jgi:hypothetical protein
MSNVKWLPGGPGSYVLQIVTTSGDTSMFLATQYPGDDGTSLTQADADNTATALKTAVDGLSGVTGSTLTPLTGLGVQCIFDSAAWANYQFTAETPSEWGYPNIQLVAASPADGMLTSGDLTTVTSAVVSFAETLTDVTGCTVAQETVSPSGF